MKKTLFLILTILSSFSVLSQNESNIKMVQKGDLFEVTIYYNNGGIMQQGFMTPNNKLHDIWKSYYEDGSKKCEAIYYKGKKTGVWHYFYKNEKTKRVTYKDNKVVKVEELESLDN